MNSPGTSGREADVSKPFWNRLARHRAAPRRAASTVALTAALLLTVTAIGPSTATVSADPVADLQQQARQIAERLDELQRQSGVLAEQFNASQVRAAELKTQIAAARERLNGSRAERENRRSELARYALGAYVHGGGTDDFDLVVNGQSDELSRRQGYTNVALGDRQQLIDNLKAAERAADDDLASLEQAERDLADEQATILRKSQEASELAAEQERIQARVEGELAVAVAEQQQRMAAEAEAAARARFGAPADAPTPAPSATPAQPGTPPTTTVAPPSTGPGTTTTVATVPQPTGPAPTTPPTTAVPPTTVAPPVVNPPEPPPSNGVLGQRVVAAAMSQQGVPYSWGGGSASGPTLGFGPGAGTVGYDCSGLTLYAWAQAGIPLARVAQSQYDTILHVPMSSLQPGDLVFYGSSSRSIGHVAIYIGGGQVVHAPHTGAVVRTASLYLGGSFGWVGAGRPAA